MDLWRLLEDSPREIQDCGHAMTPSGDAPEPSAISPIYCRRSDGNDKVKKLQCKEINAVNRKTQALHYLVEFKCFRTHSVNHGRLAM